MRRIIVASALGVCLATAAAAPALGGVSHPAKAKVFASTAKPNPAKIGQKVTLSSTKAMKSTAYDCVETVIKGAEYTYDANTITSATSNSKGDLKCTITATKFTDPVVSGGHGNLSCPPTKAEKKKGFSCAVSAADAATQGQTSASVAKFAVK